MNFLFKYLNLFLGDPTIFGNLKPCEEITNAMVDSIQSIKYNGYFPAAGSEEARRAVAEYCSIPGAELDWKVSITTKLLNSITPLLDILIYNSSH